MKLVRNASIIPFETQPQHGDVLMSTQLTEPRFYNEKTAAWEPANSERWVFEWIHGQRSDLLQEECYTNPNSGIRSLVRIERAMFQVTVAVREAWQLCQYAKGEVDALTLPVSRFDPKDKTQFFTIQTPILPRLLRGEGFDWDDHWNGWIIQNGIGVPTVYPEVKEATDKPQWYVRILGKKSRSPGKVIDFGYSSNGDATLVLGMMMRD